jgi:3-oxoacyl-[acyl-carrier protein] reductase
MKELTGKVALVTGASKGIGAAIARAFGAAGAAVVVNYAAGRAGAETVVSDIVREGGRAVAVQADMARATDVQRLLDETRETYGRLDVLVNNAGVYRFDPLEAVSEEEFHREFDVNVLGPIIATREAVALFGDEGGSVINISSVASEAGMPGSVVYAATKGALDAVTRVLANELGARRIRVNTLAPGGVETEGTHRNGMVGSDLEKEMVRKTPLGRLGQPDDIADVALFLASDRSRWLTGERIAASGGLR